MTAAPPVPTVLPWWLRALSRLPLPVLYALTGALAWCARVLLRFREQGIAMPSIQMPIVAP